MSELLHINADDVDFTITTGRSVPSFLYGTRTLPEDVWGIPSFILDSTALRVNEYTREVEQTPDQEFVYGGDDGRDLISRSTPLPRGGFSFTRTNLNVSRTEEELPDGSTLRKTEKDFDVEGTIRRVTGDTSFQAVLGPEHLGTIVPGRDIKVGEHILLGIWGMKVEVRVTGYEHTSKGYSMTIESLHTNTSKSVTNSVTTVSEKIEILSRKMREIEDTQSAYSPDDWGSEPAGSGGSGEPGPTEPSEPSGPPEMYFQVYTNGLIYGSGPMEAVSEDNSDGYNFLNILFKENSLLRETSGMLLIYIEAQRAGEYYRKLSGTWPMFSVNGTLHFDHGASWVKNGDFEIRCLSYSEPPFGTRDVIIRSPSSVTGESGFQVNTYIKMMYIPTNAVFR